MLDLPAWFEIGTFVVLGLLLVADLLVVTRRPHVPSMKEAGVWVAFYVGLALVFGLLMLWVSGGQAAGEFYAGWLTEYSLSVDNLFVFIIILAQFRVPRQYQQSVLMVGILLAIVFRGIFILIGAAAINTFAWVFYIFGAFLIYTAVKLARQQVTGEHEGEREGEVPENALIRMARRVLPLSDEYHGGKLSTRADGRRVFTPLIIVFLALASTDLLFAVDSIPAIFGLTHEAFIVFTANIFALMGLRQLYFLLGGLVDRLVYLSAGLAFILAFIGVKLVLHALHVNELPFVNGGEPLHGVPEVPIWLSLAVIIGTLAVATVASLLRTRRLERRDARMAEAARSAAIDNADGTVRVDEADESASIDES